MSPQPQQRPTKTEAIKAFLMASTHRDLAERYHFGMEVQVNVAQDDGERIEGDFRGRQWHGFTDGVHDLEADPHPLERSRRRQFTKTRRWRSTWPRTPWGSA